jgi:2-phosphosulfolactate phosphatase
VVVVVDVLSFTTTLSVALDGGIEVLPHPWDAPAAAAYAERHGATLAVGRTEGRSTGAVSLSPGSVRAATGVRRLVMPSPNGSAIAHEAAGRGLTVLGACLRNASAVVARLDGREVGDVLLVPAGERWPDGSLRLAVEDLLGAGAVADGLAGVGADLSPEAHAAAAAFRDARPSLRNRLLGSVSGRELVGKGFEEDVHTAAELDTSPHAAVLDGLVFRAG